MSIQIFLTSPSYPSPWWAFYDAFHFPNLHVFINIHNVRDKTNMLHIPNINKTIFVDLLVDLIKKYQNQMSYKLMFIYSCDKCIFPSKTDLIFHWFISQNSHKHSWLDVTSVFLNEYVCSSSSRVLYRIHQELLSSFLLHYTTMRFVISPYILWRPAGIKQAPSSFSEGKIIILHVYVLWSLCFET